MKLSDLELLMPAYDEAKRSSFNYGINLSKQYPDHTPIVDSEEAWKVIKDWNRVAILRPNSMNSFITAMMFFSALRDRGSISNGRLLLPFVPGSRQDRLNESGDALFTLKFVANLINSIGFQEVRVLDPHSDVTPALINNCSVVKVDSILPVRKDYSYSAVIAPDAGAEKRALLIAKKLGVPLFTCSKTRDIATGKIVGYSLPSNIESIDPKKALVVDDICDGGATFLTLGRLLKDKGFKSDLYVTHGIFSKGTGSLLSLYNRIYTTDSITYNTIYPTEEEVQSDYNGVVLIPHCYHEYLDL